MTGRPRDAPSVQPVAIVLAAGAGKRMGGSKALLLVDGEPLAVLHARRLRAAGCGAVVIVTRPELVDRLRAASSSCVASEAPDPAGSLAVGLRSLRLSPSRCVVVTPGRLLSRRAWR